MRSRLDLRYSLLTLAYLGAIYWLSAVPDLGGQEQHPLVRLLMNLGHAPLFAGLAFCVLKSLARVGEGWWERYALAFAVSAACAAFDEWHQTFVPGRLHSVVDLLLDLAGIGGMLLVLRVHDLRKEGPASPPGTRFPTTGQVAVPIPLAGGSITGISTMDRKR